MPDTSTSMITERLFNMIPTLNEVSPIVNQVICLCTTSWFQTEKNKAIEHKKLNEILTIEKALPRLESPGNNNIPRNDASGKSTAAIVSNSKFS